MENELGVGKDESRSRSFSNVLGGKLLWFKRVVVEKERRRGYEIWVELVLIGWMG